MPLFFAAALLAFFCDQLSKLLVRRYLAPYERWEVLPGWIHLNTIENHGAAWGVLSGQKLFLLVFTFGVIVIILKSAREVVAKGKLAAMGLGLVLGGALGNFLDRLAFGHVTDFFDLDTPLAILRDFPVFNVADSALTVGVILLMAAFLWAKEPISSEPTSDETRSV